MRLVWFVNGMVVLFISVLMVLDGLLFSETADIFLEAGAISGVIGGFVSMAVRGASFQDFRRPHTFLLTVTVWLTATAAGALPLYLWGLSAVDAIFETMSAITTTGATVMSGLDQTEHGILMWRAILQGVGGVGFIVAAMALLPMLRVGGMQLFRTESSDKNEKEFRHAGRFAGATIATYLGLLVLCAAVYGLGGMNGFDAVTHALTTLSTGGFSNYDASFGHFDSSFLQWACTLFMLLGGLPFIWYIRIVTRRVFRSEQVRAMLITLSVVIGLMSVWLTFSSDMWFFDALRLVAFNVVSVVTTTGFATTDYTLWGPLAVAVFFGLTAVGGCTGSTSGGGKAMRWLILSRVMWTAVKHVRYPNAIFPIRYEGHPVDEDVVRGVVSFFSFYFATFFALAALLELFGLDLETAISGSLTALANVGPGVGGIIGPAGNFATLNDPAKLLLAFGMFAGRLEMMTVFALFLPVFWREL